MGDTVSDRAGYPAHRYQGWPHWIDWVAVMLGVGILLGQIGSYARIQEIRRVVDRNAEIVKQAKDTIDEELKQAIQRVVAINMENRERLKATHEELRKISTTHKDDRAREHREIQEKLDAIHAKVVGG